MKSKEIYPILLLIFTLFKVCCVGQNSNVGLIAKFGFNADVLDQSGKSNNGIEHGGLEYVEDRFGNKCGALQFNGIDSYVEVPTSRSLESPSDELTVTAWVKLDAFSDNLNWVTLICKSNISQETLNSPQYRVQGTRVTLSINTEFTEPLQLSMQKDKWYHYAVVYDGGEVRGYLDGRSFFSFLYSGYFYANSMPLEIGRDVPGALEYFHGSMDDLRIFNRALSDRDILQIYKDNSEKTAKMPCGSLQNPPVVNITNPISQPFTSPNEDFNVEALIEFVDDKKGVSFYLNGNKIQKFTFDPNTGDFSVPIRLNPGKNTIKVEGENMSGQDDDSVVINYIPSGPPPEITIVAPKRLPHDSSKEKQLIEANIEHVNQSKDIEFKINGRISSDFSYKRGQFSIEVDLSKGSNVFEISAINDFGKDKETGIINFNPKLQPPVVDIIFPAKNPHKHNQKEIRIRIEATIKYVENSKDIQFTVNGIRNNQFSYNKKKDLFEASINLVPGNNFFEIIATNNDGTDNEGKIVTYEDIPALPSPLITILYPTGQPENVDEKQQAIEATIENIRGKNDISFLFNGKELRNFSFDVQTKMFKTTQDLVLGYNQFEITAKNEVGADRKTGGFMFQNMPKKDKPPVPPIGKLVVKEKVRLKSPNVRLVCFDHKKEDGDIVSVIFNDEVLIDKQELKALDNGAFEIDLPAFQKGKRYLLISKAWNLGKIPPNTMTIQIFNGIDLIETIVLESDLGKSEAIELYYK